MSNIAKPWMFAYAICFGLLSITYVHNNVTNAYSKFFIVWSGIFYIAVFAGNLIYSFNLITLKIQNLWKFVFPIVILEFIFSAIIDLLYSKQAQGKGFGLKSIALVITIVLFLPTFWAHYKIGYGKGSNT